MSTTDVLTEQTEAIFSQIARERNRCGPALLQVALDAARAVSPGIPINQLQHAIVEQIDKRLRPFTGDARMMTDKGWSDAYEKAEMAARRELMESSPEQKEADRLNRSAEQSRKLADQAENELRCSWVEFLDIPSQKDKLEAIFVSIAHERAMLDPVELKSSYQRLYRHALAHPSQDIRDRELAFLPLLLTAEWRKEVLSELEKETNSKLEKLRNRNKELAKRLGRPAHDLR